MTDVAAFHVIHIIILINVKSVYLFIIFYDAIKKKTLDKFFSFINITSLTLVIEISYVDVKYSQSLNRKTID